MVGLPDELLPIDRIRPLGATLSSRCPCCREALRTGMVDAYPVLFCAGCHGLLMKNSDFGAALRERRARRPALEAADPQPIDPDQLRRLLTCPGCNARMEVHPYYGPGNVVIDSCARCSYVWLDHSELSQLEQAGGGRTANSSQACITLSTLSGNSAPSAATDVWRWDWLAELFL